MMSTETGETANCLKISLNENGCSIDCCPTNPKVTATCSPVVNPVSVDGSCSTHTITIPNLTADPIAIPEVGNVTEVIVSGDGVFDRYMRAGNAQLQTQYDLGRIKGADYASAYVQMMEMMMTQANKFVLDLAQAEIAINMYNMQYVDAGYSAALKVAQAEKTKNDSDLICQQIAELKANGAVERTLKEEQAKETIVKAALTCQQTAELEENGWIERSLKKTQGQVQVKTAELYDRQIKGFDEKHLSDLSGQLLDAWAIQGAEFPDISEPSHLSNLSSGFSTQVQSMITKAGL